MIIRRSSAGSSLRGTPFCVAVPGSALDSFEGSRAEAVLGPAFASREPQIPKGSHALRMAGMGWLADVYGRGPRRSAAVLRESVRCTRWPGMPDDPLQLGGCDAFWCCPWSFALFTKFAGVSFAP